MKNIGNYIAVLARQINLYFNHELSDIEITATELLYLSQLYTKDGILQEQMADALSIDRGATTRTIQSMEKKGLVRRKICLKDRRARRVFLTDKAYSYRDRLKEIQDSWIKGITRDMTSEEIKTFLRLIRQMAARAKEMNQSKESGN